MLIRSWIKLIYVPLFKLYGIWAGSGKGQVEGICKCGNEPSGFIKCGEFLDQLRTG